MNKTIIQNKRAISIQLGETGQIYVNRIYDGEYKNIEEITKMLNEGQFTNKVLVTLFDKETSDSKLMPSQKNIDRLYKIIYGTHYKIVYRNGPVWEIENGY